MALVIGIVLTAMVILLACNWQFAIRNARQHLAERQQSQFDQVRRAIEQQLGRLTEHVNTVQAMLSAPDARPGDDTSLLHLLTTLVRHDPALATLSVVRRRDGQYRSVFRVRGEPAILYATAGPDGIMLSGPLETWQQSPEQLQRNTGFYLQERLWYFQAVANPGLNWTPVYRYHASGALAIGASLASTARDTEVVIAADYLLSGLDALFGAVGNRAADALVLLDWNLQIIAGNLEDLPALGQRVRAAVEQQRESFRILLRYDSVRTKTIGDLQFQFSALELGGNQRYWLLHVHSGQALIERAAAQVGPLIWLSLAIVLLTMLVIMLVARRISVPLRQLTDLSTQFSRGDWGGAMPDSRILEITRLSHSFQLMGTQIKSNLAELELKVDERTRQLQAVNDALQQSNLTDPLTRIANRRYFHQQMDALFQSGQSITLALLDVDHFKQFNDRHGHPAGDEALIHLAALLRTLQRADTHVARIGGEEFAIIRTGSGEGPLQSALESIRTTLPGLEFQSPEGERLTGLSVSIGMARQQAGDRNWTALYARADAALYRAKTQGRNQLVVDGTDCR